jgi:hypothetical protein
MAGLLKTIFIAVVFCQAIFLNGFGAAESVFAKEPAPLSVKSGGAWQKPALLSKAVNSSNRSVIISPAAAINDSGDGIAVWVQPDKEKLPRVQMSEYRDGKWLEPVFLSLPSGKVKNPIVAMAGNGDVIVAWEQRIERNSYIFTAERRNGSWKMPKSDTEHISLTDKYAWEPDVAINDKGETIIVWSQESASGIHAIYKSEYRDGAWKHPQDVNDYISPQEGSDALSPQVVMNNSGAALIAWEQPGNDDKSLIFMSEFREGKWSHPDDLNDHISPKSSSRKDSAHRPLVGMDDEGNAAISWQQRYGSKQGIFLSEYRGGKWRHPKSSNKTISPSEAKSPSIHDLQMGGNGNVIILWASYEMRRDALYKNEFIKGKWNHPTKDEPFISSSSEWEFKVLGKSAVSDGDRAIIVWIQRGTNNESRAYFVEYGKGKWHLPGQLLNNKNTQATGMTLSSSSKGNSVIVWTETDGKNEQIYSKVFRVKE